MTPEPVRPMNTPQKIAAVRRLLGFGFRIYYSLTDFILQTSCVFAAVERLRASKLDLLQTVVRRILPYSAHRNAPADGNWLTSLRRAPFHPPWIFATCKAGEWGILNLAWPATKFSCTSCWLRTWACPMLRDFIFLFRQASISPIPDFLEPSLYIHRYLLNTPIDV